MPIIIREDLPAYQVLQQENIFVVTPHRAVHQDIRPLRIAILNLMPNKTETEVQLMRLLSNTPLQVEIELLQMKSHHTKNTSAAYLDSFYKTFDAIKDKKFDGMIITGAPIENYAFEDVDFWEELCEILEWEKSHVFSVLHICWGAQAALHYFYDIPKYILPEKKFGIYSHIVEKKDHILMRGFDDIFYCPHSRHTEVRTEDIQKVQDLEILAQSTDAGPHIIADKSGRRIFITGHFEYDANSLQKNIIGIWRKDCPYKYLFTISHKMTPAKHRPCVGKHMQINFILIG